MVTPEKDPGWPMAAHLMDFLGKTISQWDPAALLNLSPSVHVGSCISASCSTLRRGTGLRDAFRQQLLLHAMTLFSFQLQRGW